MPLKNIIEHILNPFSISLILLGISTLLIFRGTNTRLLKILLPLTFLTLFTISTSWLPSYLTKNLVMEHPYVAEVDPAIQWVVVLGGGQVTIKDTSDIPANEILQDNSMVRLIEGVRLFRLLPHAKLMLSGGSRTDTPTVSENMAILAQWFSIPEQNLVVERESLNTADQARKIKTILHDQPFYLVTSSKHLPRAMILFEKMGLHPLPAPSDTMVSEQPRWTDLLIPNVNNMVYTNEFLHEFLGTIWARLTKVNY